MKFILIITISLFTSFGFAAEAEKLADNGNVDTTTQWRFGVGLGVQAQMQGVSEIEVGTGELFHCRNHGFSLILNYLGTETELENPEKEHYSNHSYRLLVETKLHGNNQFAKAYARVGVGYTDTERLFQKDGAFVTMPVQIGLDTKIMQTDSSYLAFYAQAGSDVNFLGKNTRAKNFDGIAVTLGFRGYY